MVMDKGILEMTASNVVRIPRKLNCDERLSFNELFLASGYASHWKRLSIDILRAMLEASPELQGDWIQWSADKRVRSGWYVEPAKGDYLVGYFDGTRSKQIERFKDRALAVASFVKRELEAHRQREH